MKFSIITPSFGQLDMLRKCALSICDQSGEFEIEHLVQDGEGSDELRAWANSQKFSSVVSEPDLGMYDAINKGFLRAKGDIFCWINCDEQYLPGTLSKVQKWFRNNPDEDVLIGDVILVDSVGKPLAYRKMMRPSINHTRFCFLASFSAATFVRKRIIESGHYLDTKYRAAADAVWIYRMLKSGVKFGVLNEPLATFSLTGNNLGQAESSKKEGVQWRIDEGIIKGRWLWRPFHEFIHRVMKFLHGAYLRRDVCVDIYVDECNHRKRLCNNVGGGWSVK